jgi:uncharacterized protein YdcH (DUF465 family)
MSAFDPHSNDAMFARVLAKLDEHGEVLDEIRKAGQQTERRSSPSSLGGTTSKAGSRCWRR